MVRSLLYYEMLDFKSNFCKLKHGLILISKQSKCNNYHKVKLCCGPEGHCDMF